MSELFEALLSGLSDADLDHLERLLGPLRPRAGGIPTQRSEPALRTAEADLLEEIRLAG